MRVPGFGRSSQSYNSFIIIALLDEWKNREKGSQQILREAIGQVVSVPETFAFPISPQGIRVSSYNKPVQMVIADFQSWKPTWAGRKASSVPF